jgi:hypothetical protein
MENLKPMTEDLKEALVQEHPDGLWLVPAEEYPQQQITAGDLLGVDEH